MILHTIRSEHRSQSNTRTTSRSRLPLPGTLQLALRSFALVALVLVPAAAHAATTRYVAISGNDTANTCSVLGSPCASIQHAIDVASAGDTIHVLPGTYSETAGVPSPPGCTGDTVGLFIGANKTGLTIQGVDSLDVPITNAASVLATINTNSNLCFGPDGIFVLGDNITIAGVRVGTNTGGQNKTIELWGDNFTLKNSDIADLQGSVYVNDANFDANTNTSHIQRYRIDGDIFEDGVSLDIANGAGFSGPVAGRVVTGTTFYNLAPTVGDEPWPSISFNGSDTGVPWFVYSVGGAVITGNTFSNSAPDGQQIRARGTYDNTQFDWATYFTGNTFNRSVVFGPTPPANLGTFAYPNGYGTFNNVRRIGAAIQGELDHAQPGDTVLVGKGSYDESPNVAQSVTLKSAAGRALTTINLQTGPTYLGSLDVSGADVTIDGFTIVGRDGTPSVIAATNIFIDTTSVASISSVTIKNNLLQVGVVDPVTDNGDDGMGLLTTYYTTGVNVTSLSITNNIFEPLHAEGTRAFFINPGTGTFTFDGNQVTGKFGGGSLTQAQNGTVQDNTVDGQGLGGNGLGTWGYPDANVWGHTTFQHNVFRGLKTGIAVYETNNVAITCNQFSDNNTGVGIFDGYGTSNFAPATIDAHTNSFLSSATNGVQNSAATAGTVQAVNNWWGCVAGPGNPGCDNVSGAVAFTPVATSVPACASCSQDSECGDHLACTGVETCNLTTHSCQAGTPVDCETLNDGTCIEPTASCVSPLLIVNQAELKRQHSPTVANGSVSLKGTLTTTVAEAFLTTPKITIHVADDLTYSGTNTWTVATDCRVVGTKRMTCGTADKRFKGKFTAFPATPTVYRFTAKLQKQASDLMEVFDGPVTVTVTFGPPPPPDGSLEHVGTISDCRQTALGLKCRQF